MIFEELKSNINKKNEFIIVEFIRLFSLVNYINLMTFDFYGKLNFFHIYDLIIV